MNSIPVYTEKKDYLLLSLVSSLAGLVVWGALGGLLFKASYSLETENWRLQGVGQDMIDLFLVTPILIISGIQTFRQKKPWYFVYGGTVLFLAYTFVIYCFALHFNQLFLIYCLSLGLSVFSFVYFISIGQRYEVKKWFDEKLPVRRFSIFLIAVAVLFYILWLSEIIPALLTHRLPASVTNAGQLTNPVHVLDLSLFLPALVIDSILLLRKSPLAILVTPVLLVFCVLMDVNIVFLMRYMQRHGIPASSPAIFALTILAGLSLLLLILFFRHLKKNLPFSL